MSINLGLRLYQKMQKAAADVADGKTGSKAKLAAAQKAYIAHTEKQAKKDATERVSDAKKKAAAIGKVKKRSAASGTAKKRSTTTKKRSTGRRTAAKRRK